MTDDRRTRLQQAIVEARLGVRQAFSQRAFDAHSCADHRQLTKDNPDTRSCARRGQCDYFDAENRQLDRYAALAALEARYTENWCEGHNVYLGYNAETHRRLCTKCHRSRALDAEADKLLGEDA